MILRRVRMGALGAALGLMVGGCTKSEAPAAKTKEAPAKAAASQPAAAAEKAPAAKDQPAVPRGLHRHMQEHFVKADELKEAVVAGNLGAAKAAAAWIADHEPPKELPKIYLPHAARLKKAAKKVSEGSGASEVAHGAAEMAAACADCHMAREKKIDFGADPEPAIGEDATKSHMARHAWAVTRMWDGVVGGSGELYMTGAKTLSELPLLAISLKEENKLLGLAADQIIDQLKTSADKAAKAETPEARAEVLGAVLSTCGNCHAMLQKGPATP